MYFSPNVSIASDSVKSVAALDFLLDDSERSCSFIAVKNFFISKSLAGKNPSHWMRLRSNQNTGSLWHDELELEGLREGKSFVTELSHVRYITF